MPDERSVGVLKILRDIYPAFEKKIFESNKIMERLIMSGFNSMDILQYPICGKCETLAPYSLSVIKNGKRVQTCTCMRCRQTTVNPVTFRDWIKDEIRHKATPEILSILEYAVDRMAERMVQRYTQKANSIVETQNMQNRHRMGIVMPDGSTHEVPEEEPMVIHHGYGKVELPKDAIIIKEDN